MKNKFNRPSVEAVTDTITDLLKFAPVRNSRFKHSYLFIYWIKCYDVLESYCWLNCLNIRKVSVWYDQAQDIYDRKSLAYFLLNHRVYNIQTDWVID